MKRGAALIAAVFAVLTWRVLAIAQQVANPSPQVLYTISLSQPAQHLLHIRITVPPGKAEQELQLPVWNALYQVRDFSQYVNWVRATDLAGAPLPLRELNDSRWQISGAQAGALVDYEIFADKPGPFNAQFDSHHAFLNLAQVLMYPVDARSRVNTVEFRDVPEHGVSPRRCRPFLRQATGPENYDQLVDSPVEIGTFQESDFDESGGHFRVIVDADPADYDMAKARGRSAQNCCLSHQLDERPAVRYLYVSLSFSPRSAGGGMEHAYSTAIDINADSIKKNSAT